METLFTDEHFINAVKNSLLVQEMEKWAPFNKTASTVYYKLSDYQFPRLPLFLSVTEIDIKQLDPINYSNLFECFKVQYKKDYTTLLVQYGSKPQRIWSFIPNIHEKITEIETRYTVFNAARAAVFEELEKEYGFTFQKTQSFPAATCVGTKHGSTKWILIMCGTLNRCHYTTFENPDQVPSFNYPKIYSPVPPKFSRALVTENLICYLSGTAAIKNHKSIKTKDVYQHYYTTCENITILKEYIEQWYKPNNQNNICPFVLQSSIVYCPDKKYFRSLSVLLEQAQFTEYSSLDAYYFNTVLDVPDQNKIHYLLADVCRPELLVEIESLYMGVPVFK